MTLPPELGRWSRAQLDNLTDEQAGAMRALAALIIAGLAERGAVKTPAVVRIDYHRFCLVLVDGAVRHLTPKLWTLIIALDDGEWHTAGEIAALLELVRAARDPERAYRQVARLVARHRLGHRKPPQPRMAADEKLMTSLEGVSSMMAHKRKGEAFYAAVGALRKSGCQVRRLDARSSRINGEVITNKELLKRAHPLLHPPLQLDLFDSQAA